MACHLQSDTRATALLQHFDTHSILNDTNSPTRKLFNANTQQTSPDISFRFPDIALRSTWQTKHHLSSNHLPILITYTLHAPKNRRNYRTLTPTTKKVRWTEFTIAVDDQLQSINIHTYSSTEAAVKQFSAVILNAYKQFIPSVNIRRYNPTFKRHIKHKIQTHRRLCTLPLTPNNIARIQELNTEIDANIKTEQTTLCNQSLGNVNFRTKPTRLWKLI